MGELRLPSNFMSKFKENDLVRVVRTDLGGIPLFDATETERETKMIGQIAKVIKITDEDYPIYVEFTDEEFAYGEWEFLEEELELVFST